MVRLLLLLLLLPLLLLLLAFEYERARKAAVACCFAMRRGVDEPETDAAMCGLRRGDALCRPGLLWLLPPFACHGIAGEA